MMTRSSVRWQLGGFSQAARHVIRQKGFSCYFIKTTLTRRRRRSCARRAKVSNICQSLWIVCVFVCVKRRFSSASVKLKCLGIKEWNDICDEIKFLNGIILVRWNVKFSSPTKKSTWISLCKNEKAKVAVKAAAASGDVASPFWRVCECVITHARTNTSPSTMFTIPRG